MLPRANSSFRLLQIAPRLPWPLDTGAKLRNFHLGRVLSDKAAVTLLAFESEQTRAHEFAEVYENVVSVPRDGHNSFSKLVRGAIGPTPLPLLNYTTPELASHLRKLLTAQKFDLVQFESIHLLAYLPLIRDAVHSPLAVLDWHNIESDLLKQYSKRESNPLKKLYARRTAKLMRKAEQRAAREFDAHIVVSEADAKRLRQLNPDGRVFVVENGVDVAEFAELAHASQKDVVKKRVVFVASMDYHANIDAALSFARNVWPRVHELQSNLVFTIVGREPTREVRDLAAITGIEVTGTVDDVRPFYREAFAAIAPLRVGGGSRLKILEAMAAGVPVVATTLGAEGLEVQHGENILIADSTEAMRDAIVSMAQDSDRRAGLIARGLTLVESRYDWSQLGAKLFDSYQTLVSESRSS